MNTNSRTAKSIARRNYGNGLIFIAAMAYSLASPAEQLPVFKLAEPKIDHGKASAILANLHGEEPDSTAKRGDKENIFLERAGSIEVEIYKASGGIFLRDTQRLWNRALKPKLPSRDEAKKFADRFLAENDLLPSGDQYIEVSFEGFSETGISSDTPGRVDKTILDIEANYQVDLVIEQTKDDQKFVVPVVGGGGDFKVAVGEGGRVIGFHGVWRPIAEVASIEEIMPKAEAEAKLKGTLGNAKATKIESFLAYYSAPAFEQQRFLAPVWVIQAEGKFGDMSGVQKVPLRTAIIAATKFGPEFPVIPPKERIRDDRIHDDATPLSSLDDEARKSFLDLLLPAAHAQNPFEAGTSWIGPSQGLGGSPANAQGFVDGLAGAGWNINFNWGEAAAWESDWNSSDDSWVDAVDFVFYTGHASSDGWVLNTPDDSFLHFNEVGATPGSPNDRYGQTI